MVFIPAQTWKKLKGCCEIDLEVERLQIAQTKSPLLHQSSKPLSSEDK
jgi:hypothetical protein